ncbi:hypothetical protein HC766_03030 [Candidatus Gracilibacteria bacterium]|nr:hypothetical protein [Candidatus Gracilibacteria bacterium]
MQRHDDFEKWLVADGDDDRVDIDSEFIPSIQLRNEDDEIVPGIEEVSNISNSDQIIEPILVIDQSEEEVIEEKTTILDEQETEIESEQEYNQNATISPEILAKLERAKTITEAEKEATREVMCKNYKFEIYEPNNPDSIVGVYGEGVEGQSIAEKLRKAEKVCIGDLHGNFVKLIETLVAADAVYLEDNKAKELYYAVHRITRVIDQLSEHCANSTDKDIKDIDAPTLIFKNIENNNG